jgi:hypothetical protein
MFSATNHDCRRNKGRWGELGLSESVENYPLGQRERDPLGDVFNRSTELNDSLLSAPAVITT